MSENMLFGSTLKIRFSLSTDKVETFSKECDNRFMVSDKTDKEMDEAAALFFTVK